MPCGGIYPLTRHWSRRYLNPNDRSHACFQCGSAQPPVTHFVEEWDAYLHGGCIDDFLNTPEGRIVLDHGHEVERD